MADAGPPEVGQYLPEAARVEELPISSGALDLDAVAGQLLDALRRSVESGQGQEAHDAVRRAANDTEPGSAARTLLTLSQLRVNDNSFRHHGVDGLTIRRVDFVDPGRVALEDWEVVLEATPEGGFIPRSTRAGERVLANMSCAIQLLVGTPEDYTLTTEPPALDLLPPETAMLLRYGNLRRAAWGVGQCLLTDQRAVGLIHTDVGETPGGRDVSLEDLGPLAMIGSDMGSVVVFSADREVFDECDIGDVPMFRRRPHIEFIGRGCILAITTHAVLDERERLRKPQKGMLTEAARAFVPETEHRAGRSRRPGAKEESSGTEASTASSPTPRERFSGRADFECGHSRDFDKVIPAPRKSAPYFCSECGEERLVAVLSPAN